MIAEGDSESELCRCDEQPSDHTLLLGKQYLMHPVVIKVLIKPCMSLVRYSANNSRKLDSINCFTAFTHYIPTVCFIVDFECSNSLYCLTSSWLSSNWYHSSGHRSQRKTPFHTKQPISSSEFSPGTNSTQEDKQIKVDAVLLYAEAYKSDCCTWNRWWECSRDIQIAPEFCAWAATRLWTYL